LPNETITKLQARQAAIEAQKTALKAAANVDYRGLHELSVAAGAAQEAIAYESGGEGRKGKG
jgi:hypothetical protein